MRFCALELDRRKYTPSAESMNKVSLETCYMTIAATDVLLSVVLLKLGMSNSLKCGSTTFASMTGVMASPNMPMLISDIGSGYMSIMSTFWLW